MVRRVQGTWFRARGTLHYRVHGFEGAGVQCSIGYTDSECDTDTLDSYIQSQTVTHTHSVTDTH